MRSYRKNRRKKKKIMRFLGGGAVLLAVLLLCFFVFFRDSRKEELPAVKEMEESELLPEILPEEKEQTEEAQVLDMDEEELVSTVKEVPDETGEITLGIDVSEFQGNIDWDQVASSGIDFVMVRVGYRTMQSGEIKEDAAARYNLQEAGKRGLKLGAYFFSTAVNVQEAKEEAEWVKEFLKGYGITYPVAYNCEGFNDPSGRHYHLTIDERTSLASAFLDTIEEGGYTGMFYAARNELLDNLMWDASTLELKYRMWVAQYPEITYPELAEPSYPGKFAMWQYTNKGTVPGIKQTVDLDVAYFGYSQTSAPMDADAAVHVDADVEIGVSFEEVNEQVTSKDVTNLRSTMDQGSESNVVAKLKNGETATRTGIGKNGWSRVEYNGQTLYAVSSYLTTDVTYKTPVKETSEFKTQFTKVSENVTAKEVTNLRNRPSVEEPSQVIVQLHNGEVILRTGVSDMGWSRVEYNGQTLYCISSYLQVVE